MVVVTFSIKLAPRTVNGKTIHYPEQEFESGSKLCRHFEKKTKQLIVEDKNSPFGVKVIGKKKRKKRKTIQKSNEQK